MSPAFLGKKEHSKNASSAGNQQGSPELIEGPLNDYTPSPTAIAESNGGWE